MCTQFCQYKSRYSVIWSVIWWSYLVKLRLYTNLHATHCTNSQYQSFKFLLPGISNDFLFISAMSLCMDSSYLLKFWSLPFLLEPSRYSHFTVNFHNSNIWRPNECFWYLLFLLSHSVVFLYFFALIPEEGFLISPCYSLELCIQMVILLLSSLPFALSYSQLFVRPLRQPCCFFAFLFLGDGLDPCLLYSVTSLYS